MANVYLVELNNGHSFTVTTPEYHEHHSREVFTKHLGDIISRTGSAVAAQMIIRYLHKGTN